MAKAAKVQLDKMQKGDVLRLDGCDYRITTLVETGRDKWAANALRESKLDEAADSKKSIWFDPSEAKKAEPGELSLILASESVRTTMLFGEAFVTARRAELAAKFAKASHSFWYIPGRLLGRPDGTSMGITLL